MPSTFVFLGESCKWQQVGDAIFSCHGSQTLCVTTVNQGGKALAYYLPHQRPLKYSPPCLTFRDCPDWTSLEGWGVFLHPAPKLLSFADMGSLPVPSAGMLQPIAQSSSLLGWDLHLEILAELQRVGMEILVETMTHVPTI